MAKLAVTSFKGDSYWYCATFTNYCCCINVLVIAFLQTQCQRLKYSIYSSKRKLKFYYLTVCQCTSWHSMQCLGGFSLASSWSRWLSGGILAELAYLLTIIPAAIPAASAELKLLAETSEPLKNYLASLPSGLYCLWVIWGPQGCLLVSCLHSCWSLSFYFKRADQDFNATTSASIIACLWSFNIPNSNRILLSSVSTNYNVHRYWCS